MPDKTKIGGWTIPSREEAEEYTKAYLDAQRSYYEEQLYYEEQKYIRKINRIMIYHRKRMKPSNRCICVLFGTPRKHYKKARFKRMIKRSEDRT